MNNDKLYILCQVHGELIRAAELPETTRPISISSKLDKIEALMLNELEKETPNKSQDDDIPF